MIEKLVANVDSVYYWPTIMLLVTAICSGVAIVFKAIFYDARSIMYLLGFFMILVIASMISKTFATVVAVAGLVLLLGWTVYYVWKDWSSKGLRITLALFVASALLSVWLVHSLDAVVPK